MQTKRFVLPLLLTTLLFAPGCSGNSGRAGSGSPKFLQYYRQGEQLYVQHCSNCHQQDGSGLRRVYPPLDTSDYMTNNRDKVICLIRYGVDEPLVVNGIEFVQPMPGIPALTDLEIAQIVTYIYNTWSHEEGIVEVKEVSEALAGCEGSK
ncbi:MAG: cytochrome c [Cyclobacteriaceae bacterium]|jgi:mono/diheme cytochrome c family protein|nr:cytochrome c [Cyclobacteriaceae bacterium]